MAEEMSAEEIAKQDDFRRNLVQKEVQKANEYLSAPQLTCGQFEQGEVWDVFENDWLAIGQIKPTEFDTFNFFANFKQKFAKEINAFEEMKERLGTNDEDKLRLAYLNENNYAPSHLARHFNPFWKLAEDENEQE